jgi:6-phosphofructokinase 2
LLDASGEPLRLALGAGVYLAKPSLREFEELTGTVQAGEPRLLDRARQLLVETRCTALVLSLGAKGALFVTATEAEQLASPGVVVASTVGAGDSMLGGIALFLAAGRSLREAVRFGLAAAASSVRHPGTQLCDPRETDLLYAQMAPAQSEETAPRLSASSVRLPRLSTVDFSRPVQRTFSSVSRRSVEALRGLPEC